MECFVFAAEPSGTAYEELIDFCCSAGSTMLLVVRDPQRDPGESIKAILNALSPYLVEESLATQWPGTMLLADEAAVYRYRINEELRKLLRRQRVSLFDWTHPDAPEDPCFFRSNGDMLLTTISHENDAYLMLSPGEFESLRERYPALGALLRKE